MKQQRWNRLEVTVGADAVEALANYLMELGSPGLQLEELGEQTIVKAYLPGEAAQGSQAVGRYLRDLAALGLHTDCSRIRVERLAQEDWLAACRESFHPLRVGRKLLVRPSWSEEPPGQGRVTIIIDPQMAFGTGQHPTTAFCLRALEDLLRGGEAVLDVGTGSGIVSIAAAKLGAARVRGIDNDPLAVETARENARINGVSHLVEFSVCEAKKLTEGRYQLVVANIDGATLLPLLTVLKGAMQTEARLVLAGLLRSEEEPLQRRLSAAGLRLERIERGPEWLAAMAGFAEAGALET
jgi:ribosomal protein L11 methyltransferase